MTCHDEQLVAPSDVSMKASIATAIFIHIPYLSTAVNRDRGQLVRVRMHCKRWVGLHELIALAGAIFTLIGAIHTTRRQLTGMIGYVRFRVIFLHMRNSAIIT